jgi:Mlc titration factor MtfA (ptsG expression regulator)
MPFSWLADRRRRKILERPFPEAWSGHIRDNVAHYAYLDEAEKKHLRDLTQVFIAEKHWEGAGGLELTDEVRVTIAAQACLLILGLEHALYRRVESIVVYPSTVLTRPEGARIFSFGGDLPEQPTPIVGQAFRRGPVILVWDAVKSGGIDPRDGRNVVYHEFAHKLDMLTGAADGVPPLAGRDAQAWWIEVLTREYEALQAQAEKGAKTFLDTYALENGAEFFAVATEHFFEQPQQMERDHADMYGVMRGFYRQDTAARERRWLASGQRLR